MKSADGETILHVGTMDGTKEEPMYGYLQENRPEWAVQLEEVGPH